MKELNTTTDITNNGNKAPNHVCLQERKVKVDKKKGKGMYVAKAYKAYIYIICMYV